VAVAVQAQLVDRYLAFLHHEGIPYRDPTDAMVAELDAELSEGRALYPEFDDGHPFAAGYAVYAVEAEALVAAE
jgi:hypothetical protein